MTNRKYKFSDTILGTTTVADYMEWAFSDLTSNATRGVFVEFLIKTALEITGDRREEWAPYDLMYQGLRLEIKSTSLVQTWDQKQLSKGRFDIGQRESGRNSDFYIFAANTQIRRDKLDMLNFADWEFFVIATAELNQRFGAQKSIGLNVLHQYYESCPLEQVKSVLDTKIRDQNTPSRKGVGDQQP